MDNMLLQLGIDVKMLIAGFCGGVIHTFVFRQTDPYTAIGSIITGVVTANYIGGAAAKMFSISDGAAGFAVGLSAMAVCQGIVAGAKQVRIIRMAQNQDGKDDK